MSRCLTSDFQTERNFQDASWKPQIMYLKPFIILTLSAIFGGFLVLVANGQEIRDRDTDSDALRETQGRYYQPGQTASSQFRLGVQVRNTNTGVVITRVVPGTIAQQIGLEAGDTIIAVSGYQVGVVEGRTYDVGEELVRRFSRQGAATLLVLNHRNGQLVNIPVPSDPSPAAAVLGTVNTNDRTNAYPSMTLEVRLIDVTHPQWRDVVISETQSVVTGQWPLGFRLDYDPAAIRPNHRYAVEAQISLRGQTVQRTLDPVPINLSTPSPRVALTVVSSTQPSVITNPGTGPLSPIDQVDNWYVELLGRKLTDREISVWQREMSRGKPPQEVLATILGSSEYSDRFRGDQRAYITAVFQYLNRRSPSLQELTRWQARLVQLRDVRLTLVQEMLRESMKR
jgi:putative lipoprotein